MNQKEKPFQTTGAKRVWSCPWYSVRRDQIVLPGGVSGHYFVVEKGPAVWIVPTTATGELVLIRSYRHTVDDWCWEVPAGAVNNGHSLEATAVAELREEAGGTAAKLQYVGRFYPANGICDEVGHIFLATGVALAEPAHEPAEVMEVHRKPIAEVLQMARSGQISDGPSALAVLLCEPRLIEMAQAAASAELTAAPAAAQGGE
jgi:ADP-ribose pyrophosphatase